MGTLLAVGLVTLPVTTIVTMEFVQERQWRSSFPDRTQARSLIDARVREVAAAWHGMPPSVRRAGFTPLQSLTLEPANGVPESLSLLVFNGSYLLRTELPTQRPPDGPVRFANGESMVVPLVAADQAFRDISSPDDRCSTYHEPGQSPPGASCTALPVTAVRLGEVPLHTSRGLATVPAWLFSVPGLPGPVARVAVAPEAISTPPRSTPRRVAELQDVLVGAAFIDGVDGATVRFRADSRCLGVVGPVAYETAEVVVLGVQIETQRDRACIDDRSSPPTRPPLFTVTLAGPVGPRLLLSSSGELVPYLPAGQLVRVEQPERPGPGLGRFPV